MVHRLDVRAVGIQDVSGVVARVIWPLSRAAVVGSTCGERRFVEPADELAVGCLEREVEIRRRWSVRAHEELVQGEPAFALPNRIETEDLSHSRIEPLAGFEIGNPKVYVVE